MTKAIISGHSDDIVCIEGDFLDEMYPSDTDEFYLLASDGTVIKGSYDNEGMWRFHLRTQGTAIMTKVEATDPDNDYTDRVELDGVNWVSISNKVIRPLKKR